MIVKAIAQPTLQAEGFPLVDENGVQVCMVTICGHGTATERIDFERLDRALIDLINRDGLMVFEKPRVVTWP